MVKKGDVQPNQDMPSSAFTARKPGSEPLDRSGHQIAQPVGPHAHTETFHAEAHPPGTAPQSSSYYPNPSPGVLPHEGSYSENIGDITGATSRDVYKGLGKPIQGQSSAEMHHEGKHSHKKDREGLTQWGSGELTETQQIHEKTQRGPVHEKTVEDRDNEIIGGAGRQ